MFTHRQHGTRLVGLLLAKNEVPCLTGASPATADKSWSTSSVWHSSNELKIKAKIITPFYPHVQHICLDSMLIIVKSGKQKAEHKIPWMFYYRLNESSWGQGIGGNISVLTVWGIKPSFQAPTRLESIYFTKAITIWSIHSCPIFLTGNLSNQSMWNHWLASLTSI